MHKGCKDAFLCLSVVVQIGFYLKTRQQRTISNAYANCLFKNSSLRFLFVLCLMADMVQQKLNLDFAQHV